MYYYFEIPLYSIVVNLLLLPMVGLLLLAAAVAALLGLIWMEGAKWVIVPSASIVHLYDSVSAWVCTLPYANLITGKPKLETILVYELLFFGMLAWWRRKGYKRWSRGKLCLAGFALFFFCFFCPQKGEAEIVFLDVGQGDGIYIHTEDGYRMFIDGGSSSIKEVGTYRILPFLKSKGVKSIDFWFLSHADADHSSGLLEVMEAGYSIKTLIVSAQMPKDEAYAELVKIARKNQIPIRTMTAGNQIKIGDATVRCLYPSPKDSSKDRNQQSLVIDLSIEGFRCLFSGDISKEEEQKLIERKLLGNYDIYKAAHHGAKLSNSEDLLSQCGAKLVVISCGENNRYGHPHEETIMRFAEADCVVFMTPECGAIKVELQENNVRILPFKKNVNQPE